MPVSLLHHKNVILITHRPASLASADRVLVMGGSSAKPALHIPLPYVQV